MITHVAIWHNDTIYALEKPFRHHNVFELIVKEYGGFTIEGFLDHNSNFLDRREAFTYAKHCGQIARLPDYNSYQGDELFSEDLW